MFFFFHYIFFNHFKFFSYCTNFENTFDPLVTVDTDADFLNFQMKSSFSHITHASSTKTPSTATP